MKHKEAQEASEPAACKRSCSANKLLMGLSKMRRASFWLYDLDDVGVKLTVTNWDSPGATLTGQGRVALA